MPELEERIARLEATQEFMKEQISDMSDKINEMHSVMLQAKGARWAILGVASLAGFLSGKLGVVLAALGFKM